jgi:hypothetical protein
MADVNGAVCIGERCCDQDSFVVVHSFFY